MIEPATIQQVKELIRQELEVSQPIADHDFIEWVEERVIDSPHVVRLTAKQKHWLVNHLFHSFRGLDILQPLLDDPTITEIMINSYDELFIERLGEVTQAPMQFESQQKLEDMIQTIVGKVNRIVNESSPIVDARLQDGSRVHVVLPPIALKGPTMTIRKFPDQPLRMDQLISWETLTEEAAQFLQTLVQAGYNVFISGGTGSGKTTLLNVLSQYIPSDERVITIEDSAELQLRTIPNLVSLETRNANTEGRGEISIRELIKASLRMRPNRIVIGEVRGAEALDMLQAMNTGHDGSLSTGHANSTKDMLSRLETMVLSHTLLPMEVVRKQIASAIDIMIHITRMRDRSRRIVEISEVIGVQDGEVLLAPLYQFSEEGESVNGRIIGRLNRTAHPLQHTYKLENAGLGRSKG